MFMTLTEGYNNISLNSDGLSWINTNGVTKLCLRSSNDIASQPPPDSDVEEVLFYSADEPTETKYPQLELTYQTKPSIGSFNAPSEVEPNEIFLLETTIIDYNGVEDFVNATLELTGGIVLKWVNSTNTFSIQSDPNGYCWLRTNSTRTTLSSNSYKLSWRISLYGNYTEGATDVIETNTHVYDVDGDGWNTALKGRVLKLPLGQKTNLQYWCLPPNLPLHCLLSWQSLSLSVHFLVWLFSPKYARGPPDTPSNRRRKPDVPALKLGGKRQGETSLLDGCFHAVHCGCCLWHHASPVSSLWNVL